MLNSMRSKNNRSIMYILMALLIVGLTGFGISSFTGGSLRSIGSVGDEKIAIDAYARQMNQTIQSVSRQIGRNLTPAEIESSGIQRAVLAEVVATAGMDNEASRLGLSVGDAAVREELLNTPAFKSLAGEFDPEAYKFALERANLSATEYEETLRKQNARGLIESAIASGIQSGETAARTFVTFAGETRDIEWVELTADYLTTPVGEPTEEQLVEQYELNPEAYTAPLTKDITYVWLSPDSLTDQAEVTEAELREAYDINSERYNRPARRAIDRIVFGSQQEALDARARLDSGLIDFDTLAEERGLKLEDIDQGEVEQDQLPQAVADLIFNAADPGVVGPADTDLGPALYRINAIFDENITPFEEVEDDLREELAAEHTGVMVLNMLPEIDDMLAAGATLEELDAETEMELGSLSYSADVTDGIAAYDEFRIAADAAAEGDFPQIENLSDGGVFALRVDRVTQPVRIPLDEIRDQVAEDWNRAETVRRLTELGDRFAGRLAETSDFGSLGIMSETATGLTRAGFVEGTPPLLVTKVFGVDQGQAVVVEDTGSVFLAQVIKVTPVDLNSTENQTMMGRIGDQIDQQIAQDVLDAYKAAVQEAAGVTLNPNAISAVNSQLLSGGAGD